MATPAIPSPYIGKWATHPTKQDYRRHIWKTGTDELTHEQYYSWLKHKAQAAYRGEPHQLAFDQWLVLWNKDGAWANRGRQPDNVCLCRIDISLPWSRDNVEIVSRYEQLLRQAQVRASQGVKYKPRRDRGVKRGPNVK